MEAISIAAQPRTVLGKKVKSLRRSGVTPIHVYGAGGPSLALQAETGTLRPALMKAGRTSPVAISVDGADPTLTIVRDVTVHPVSGEVLHADFLRVTEDRPVTVPVRINLIGDSPATRGGQAVITQGIRTLMVRALPASVPDHVEADVSTIRRVGQALRVSHLTLPEGVEPAGNLEDVVARATRQREAEATLVSAVSEEGEGEEEGGSTSESEASDSQE